MVPFILIVLVLLLVGEVASEIYDPLNVFCGSINCYDILNVPREASIREIKKSYRKLSVSLHPDKNKEANATDVFRSLTKAYEVLTGNESRPLFDYYLDHPRDYYKVSGQHYYRNLPKSDVRFVIVVVIALLSWFFHSVQYSKYQRAVSFLKNATVNNLSLKNGGTKQTIELYRRATELYDEHIKELRAKGDKSAGKAKATDPIFIKYVDQVVGEVKIEGGYRKPELRDLFAVQLALAPYNIYLWARKYHRRYLSKQPLSAEDKEEMSREKLGLVVWEELTPEQRQKFIDMEIWKTDVYEKYTAEQEALLDQQMNGGKKSKGKKSKGLRRRGKLGKGEEDDGDDDDAYLE